MILFVNGQAYYDIPETGQELLQAVNEREGKINHALMFAGREITDEVLADSGVSAEANLEAIEKTVVKISYDSDDSDTDTVLFDKERNANEILESMKERCRNDRLILRSEIFKQLACTNCNGTCDAVVGGVYICGWLCRWCDGWCERWPPGCRCRV